MEFRNIVTTDRVTVLLLGALSFLAVLNLQVLNPENINWIGSGDPAAAQIAWEFFRSSEWNWPLGLIPKYGIGQNASLVFSDTVPLFAILFKIFDPVLPSNFQFFGFWYLAIFIGQSISAWKLSGLICIDRYYRYLTVLIFNFSPALLGMICVWSSEAAHFLILTALYLSLKKNDDNDYIYWILTLLFSVAICFYIFIIVGCLWVSWLLDISLIKRTLSGKFVIKQLISGIGLVLILAWVIGYFSMLNVADESNINTVGGSGYGVPTYNFDLISPFYSSQWSYFYRLFHEIKEISYSFNYLGLGVILGLLLVIRRIFGSSRSFFTNRPFFLLSLLVLLFIGISNNIKIGPVVVAYDLHPILINIFSVVRASNRLVWPLYYLLVFLILYTVHKSFSASWSRLLVSLIFILQFLDTSAGWLSTRNMSSRTDPQVYMTLLKNQLWESKAFKSMYKNIIRVPMEGDAIENGSGKLDIWEVFGYYAGNNGMGLNTVALARENIRAINSINNGIDSSIASGDYQKDSAYVIDDEHIVPVLRSLVVSRDEFVVIDGFNLLLPYWRECAECLEITRYAERVNADSIPEFSIGDLIFFGKNGFGSRFLADVGKSQIINRGWSYPELWGAWSDGMSASMTVPYPKNYSPHSFALKVRPFVSPNHPSQNIIIYLNNKIYKKIALRNEQDIEIELPKNSSKNYAVIKFEFLNGVKPVELGLGTDDRRLALGIISGYFK